jgi:peptide/nickel transport system substrate-binding protein
VAAAGLAACGSAGNAPTSTNADPSTWATTTPAATAPKQSVTWNLLLEPAKLDPAESDNYGESTVLANLCESLQTLKPDFTIGDGLAKVTANAARTRLVYDIDPRAKFWDGKPVTGEDAAYSLTRIWKPTGQPFWTDYFGAVSGIKATGARQVTITLRHADLLLEKLMATAAGSVVEKAYTVRHGGKIGTSSVGPMCSGPYEFVSWKSGDSVTIKRNPTYWGGTKAKVDTIKFTFLQGDATISTALVGDAVQGMYNPPFTALKELSRHGKVYNGKSLFSFYVVPTKKPGPLQDPRIREALFLALDRKAVADTAFAGAARAAGSLLPSDAYGDVKATTTPDTGGTPADLKRAKELVQQAGSPKQTIVLAANTGITESMNQTLQALVEAGNAIGLNMKFKSITLGQYYALFGSPKGWKDVNADGFGSQWNLPVADPLAQYRTWTPQNFSNYGGFSDPETTKLIDQASQTVDVASRNALLAKIDQRLFAAKPWIPITEVANTLYMANGLTGPPAAFTNWFTPWAPLLGAAK